MTEFENASVVEVVAGLEKEFEKRLNSVAHLVALGRGADAAMRSGPKYINLARGIPFTFYGEGDRTEHDQTLTDMAFELYRMGCDFKIMLAAIKDDPFLQSEWDRFMVALKMAEAPK